MAPQDPLAKRFFLLGQGLAPVRFVTPGDADWLPRNWESSDYPTGRKGAENFEAVLQWLDYQVCHYEERLIPWLENPDLAPEDPGQTDRGGPVRDAYRLVAQLQGKRDWGLAPPCQPCREYVHYQDDLRAVVAELKKVRDWVAKAAKLEQGVELKTPLAPPPEQEDPEATGTPSASSPKEPPEVVEFCFADHSGVYYIAGFGESGHVGKLKGFAQIARLIETPNAPVPMIELAAGGKDERIAADKQSRQPALTEEDKAKISQELRELRGDLDRAKSNNNDGEADRLRIEIERIEEQAKAAVGIGGKSRDLNNPFDRLRPSIHASLKRAYKALRGKTPPMKELADHFEVSISSESAAFVYRPVGASPNWSLEQSDQK